MRRSGRTLGGRPAAFKLIPGREREFRIFVSKIIFGRGDGDGTAAGVQGVAAASVRVGGFSIGEDWAVGGGDADKREC